MAFFFIVGTKDFTSPLKGYEGITAQCHNCGNWSAHPISTWDWFTFCWVPVIPLGGKHQDRIVLCVSDVDRRLPARYAVFARTLGIGQTYYHNKVKGRRCSLRNKGRHKAGVQHHLKRRVLAINNKSMGESCMNEAKSLEAMSIVIKYSKFSEILLAARFRMATTQTFMPQNVALSYHACQFTLYS
ncbi:hypothetical protein LTR10_018965 [Elasticomyces elasticus]|nr:hypothetical protein LTR10_018965 [Elasticomyces elasticus]KAK5022281.1 hypothetical protein LTS07_010157 [Exophiala sideris]KAK5177633.1 hypothetical protein LTR44_009823 [Eurotiomycetes sp. CCFEE 6388]